MEQITPTLMNWASILDQQTRQQAVQTSQKGFIYPHLALMPDAHLGKGATVGSVIPTLGNIIPAAVGVDIGCGMIAVRTQWTEKVWLSRKGAIDAHDGVLGLIPGSMGARSYVVRGLGNQMALCSSPHGAGRVHSRGSAKHRFTLEDLQQRMRGIEWRRSDVFLDEHPDAYKDIDVVMADSAELVEAIHEFRQILNVKGE